MTIPELMQWATAALLVLLAVVIWMAITASRNKHIGFQKKLEPRSKGVKR